METVMNESSINGAACGRGLTLDLQWGGELRSGNRLSPQFVLHCGNIPSPPKICLEMDPRLDGSVWSEKPSLAPTAPGVWRFGEKLNLSDKDGNDAPEGTYTLKIQVMIDEILGIHVVPSIYRTEIHFRVFSGKTGKLILEAGADSMINTTGIDLSQFGGEVVVRSEKNSIVNLNGGVAGLMKTGKNSSGDVEKQGQTYSIPFVKSIDVPDQVEPCREMVLEANFGNHVKYYRLFAKYSLLAGRSKKTPESSICTDIVYRFYKNSEDKREWTDFLSRYISRQHCRFRINESGLSVLCLGRNMGVDVVFTSSLAVALNQEMNEVSIPWTRLLSESTRTLFSHFAALELRGFPTNQADELEKILRAHSFLSESHSTDDLWRMGKTANAEAVRIRRCERLRTDLLEKYLPERERPKFLTAKANWNRELAWSVDPLASLEEFFFCLRSIAVGSNERLCPICIDARYGVTGQNALLFYCRDRFGIVNLDDRAILCVTPDKRQKALYKNDPCFLEPGMILRIGKVIFNVVE